MMAGKETSAPLQEIKKNLTSGKLTFGTNSTLKSIKTGKITKVFVTKNCPDHVRKDLATYKGIKEFEIIEMPLTNEELGSICKKPYSVSLLGLIKG